MQFIDSLKNCQPPSPVWEKVPAEQGDEGLTFALRTSSVAFGDTFSFKEKEVGCLALVSVS